MKIFLLSWKKILLIIVAWFLAVILHNIFSALLGAEEALFFTIAIFIIPIYFVIGLIYTIIIKFNKNKHE